MKSLSDDGQINFNVCVAILAVSTLAVALRFAIKFGSKLSVTGADYVCLLALLLFIGYVAVMLHCEQAFFPYVFEIDFRFEM